MTSTLQFSINLARQVGQFLIEQYDKTMLETNIKNDHSAVTAADISADHLITNSIHENYPNDGILSEELQPVVSGEFEEKNKAVWVIDPLDGTTNYSLGLKVWGVLITRVVNGQPEMSVLNFPMLGELYHTQLDVGAFLNDKQIFVEQPNPKRPFSFFACCSRTFRNYDVTVPYKTRILGSAAYTFCTVARGSAILGFEAAPKIWDIAGAWLLISEAGGTIYSFEDRQPFPLNTDLNYSQVSFPTIAAATKKIAYTGKNQIHPKKGKL
jgi:myo-inositol-1(or 4)-monophosphatase